MQLSAVFFLRQLEKNTCEILNLCRKRIEPYDLLFKKNKNGNEVKVGLVMVRRIHERVHFERNNIPLASEYHVLYLKSLHAVEGK